MPLIVRPVAHMAIRFGDLTIGCKSTALFCRGCCTPAKLSQWRLCAGDLRVCRVFRYRFANLRTAVTLSFGDD